MRLAGGLLVGGLLLNVVATLGFHPSGEEDDHEAIFTEYADSGAWVAVHLVQFVAVLTALAGLLVLYRALNARGAVLLAPLAAAATVATAASWAILQGLDGVALKQAVDAWAEASGPDEATRFADAETVRRLEWGFQSYFRVLLGLSFALFGAAIVATGLVPRWLGWVAILAGLLAAAIGIDVGYNGLESGFQDVAGNAFLLTNVLFAVGVLVAGVRHRGQLAPR